MDYRFTTLHSSWLGSKWLYSVCAMVLPTGLDIWSVLGNRHILNHSCAFCIDFLTQNEWLINCVCVCVFNCGIGSREKKIHKSKEKCWYHWGKLKHWDFSLLWRIEMMSLKKKEYVYYLTISPTTIHFLCKNLVNFGVISLRDSHKYVHYYYCFPPPPFKNYSIWPIR